jgi:hypothetical protein
MTTWCAEEGDIWACVILYITPLLVPLAAQELEAATASPGQVVVSRGQAASSGKAASPGKSVGKAAGEAASPGQAMPRGAPSRAPAASQQGAARKPTKGRGSGTIGKKQQDRPAL